jgi:hypothetical protein
MKPHQPINDHHNEEPLPDVGRGSGGQRCGDLSSAEVISDDDGEPIGRVYSVADVCAELWPEAHS